MGRIPETEESIMDDTIRNNNNVEEEGMNENENRNGSDHDKQLPAAHSWNIIGDRLLSILSTSSSSSSSSSNLLTEDDNFSNMLSYFATANNLSFDNTSSSNISTNSSSKHFLSSTFRSVITSTLCWILSDDTTNNNNNNNNGSTNMNIGIAKRRIASEGLLPLLANNYHTTISYSLVLSCVKEILLVVLMNNRIMEDDDGDGNTQAHERQRRVPSSVTMGTTILLPSLLANLHSYELELQQSSSSSSSSSLSSNESSLNETSLTSNMNNNTNDIPKKKNNDYHRLNNICNLDDILDLLCGCYYNYNSNKYSKIYIHRPSASAAMASCLAELERIIPGRITLCTTTTNTNNNNTNIKNQQHEKLNEKPKRQKNNVI